jgi:flagellar biogenesis protein FliO
MAALILAFCAGALTVILGLVGLLCLVVRKGRQELEGLQIL